jgi:hypothetical protein
LFFVGYRPEFVPPAARGRILDGVRRALVPRLEAIAGGQAPRFLMAADRLIVADYRTHPTLKSDRLARLVSIDRTVDTGIWRIQVGRPRR